MLVMRKTLLTGCLWLMAQLLWGAEETIARRIEELLGQAEYRQAHWGILVADTEWGNVVYELNADRLFAPASVTKLYSVASALDAFGAEHRVETPIYRRGEVDGAGVLNGDLVLVARGDMNLGGRMDGEGRVLFTDVDHTYANGSTNGSWTAASPLAGLNELARQVAAAGIKRVTGEILVDDRLFEKAEGTGSGPSRLTPIMVNDNLIDLMITPAAAGERARIEWRPATAILRVDAQVETVESGRPVRIRIQALPGDRIIVRGEIPVGHRPLLRVVEMPDAASFARSLLIEALGRAGVRVDASALEGNRTELLPEKSLVGEKERVAILRSAPFSEEAKLILKVSHNLHASTLPLLIAAQHGQRTLEEGLRWQRKFLEKLGVDVEAISFAGAAGGARADYVTPRATVALLRGMARRPDFSVYEAALPVLGVDGTLAGIMKEGHVIRGKVRAKTGTLVYDNVMNERVLLTSRALAGYMTTSRERTLAFAFFVNNVHLRPDFGTVEVMKTMARICQILYEQQ